MVSYFLMRAECEEAVGLRDEEEIDAVGWRTPEEAVAMLTHEEDRALIKAVFGLPR
jgi:hypothetical protein